jgi:hypothetical protein
MLFCMNNLTPTDPLLDELTFWINELNNLAPDESLSGELAPPDSEKSLSNTQIHANGILRCSLAMWCYDAMTYPKISPLYPAVA